MFLNVDDTPQKIVTYNFNRASSKLDCLFDFLYIQLGNSLLDGIFR